jgi:hypothetical protein
MRRNVAMQPQLPSMSISRHCAKTSGTLAITMKAYFKPEEGLAANLGAALGGVLLDRTVDAMVTPQSLAWIVRGYPPAADQQSPPPSPNSKPTVTMGYEDFSTFAVNFKLPVSTETFALVLSREGLSWKLTGLRLPLP